MSALSHGSLLLPPADHPVRDLFDVSHLAQVGDQAKRASVMTLDQARLQALAMAQADARVRSVQSLVLNEAGQLVLVSHDLNGQGQVLWNFEAPAVAA